MIVFRKMIPEERVLLVVLDIESADGKTDNELGVFKDRIVLGYSFPAPKHYKPTFQAKWNTKKCTAQIGVMESGIVRN